MNGDFGTDDNDTPADADTNGEPPIPEATCGAKLDCGGECYLAPGHAPPCLCVGDEDGEPGTCPA